MNRSTNEKLKAEARNLGLLSEHAKEEFRLSFAKILRLVNEKFLLENKFKAADASGYDLDLIQDAHQHFGELLLDIYENNLLERLAEEFLWYVSVLRSRGFAVDYFQKMLEGWIFAIHGSIKPPESNELSLPLEWMGRRIHEFWIEAEERKSPVSAPQKRLLDLLLQKRRKEALDYLHSLLENGFPPEDIFIDLLAPVLVGVGHLWEKNLIRVSDEHAATAIARYLIAQLLSTAPKDKSLPSKALVACVPGEEHDLGAEILAAYLETKGWAVYFLGHSSPRTDIIQAAVEIKPDVIFLSVTMVSRLSAARMLAERLKAALPGGKIILGGRALPASRNIVRDVVDFLTSDIKEAHRKALELVGHHAQSGSV